jgi:hypothetical protein
VALGAISLENVGIVDKTTKFNFAYVIAIIANWANKKIFCLA